MPSTVIPPSLLTAYRNTLYRVQATPPFTLIVGEISPALQQWIAQRQCACAAFVTACNPHSHVLSDAENAQRHCALEQVIRQCGLPYASGLGQSQDGHWKPEPSYLVGGLTLEETQALGRRFEQNAVVWCGQDALAQLILLR